MSEPKANKKRSYYKTYASGASAAALAYLVRHYDEKDNDYPCDGPFNTRDGAISASMEYLRKGVCAWVVTYNG
jgi:hypothetical protein|tara:strand:- start:437 stop:655 length:219 start_codon:yes stop_codon:yes gene_type:complete